MALNKELRELWNEAGWSSSAGSAAVCRPPANGFRRVYYLTTADHAVSNVSFSRIKISRFSQLNDPFELFGPVRSQKRASIDWRKHREEFDRVNGVLCFSSDWTDPVLWSHYGGRHQGVCLGFDVDEDYLHDVRYQFERMEIDVSGDTISERKMEEIFATKFSSWQYEEERRVLVELTSRKMEGALYFQEFDDEIVLKEVILGPLCSLNIKSMRSLVNKLHKNVVTFKARLASNSFHVVPEESSVPNVPIRNRKRTR